MSKCKEPNIFSSMISVLKEKLDDYELRVEIYTEIIEILNGANLSSTVHFLLGEDTAFDDAYKKKKE